MEQTQNVHTTKERLMAKKNMLSLILRYQSQYIFFHTGKGKHLPYFMSGQAAGGASVALHEGAPEVLHDRVSRGAAAGQDDRARAQQVCRDVRQGGRAGGAADGQARLRAHVLMQLGGCAAAAAAAAHHSEEVTAL